MNDITKSPIELIADLLATMTARAVEAERQRDEAKQHSDEWYQNWKNKDTALKEAEAKLREVLDNQKGEQENGESNR